MKNTPMDRSKTALALGAAVLALVMWSGTAIANKIAVEYMSGLTAGVLRSLLAGILALAIASSLRLPRPTTGRDWMLLVGSGVTSFAIWPSLISIGIERTTATHAAIIMATIPVFTVLITHLLQRRLPHRGWWCGAIIAIVAMIVLLTRQASGTVAPLREPTVVGDLIILSGTFICAVGYVAGGSLSRKIGSIATTFWGLATALIPLVPMFALLASGTVWPDVPARGWMAIAWMTVLSSLAGYALWFYALSTGGIARIGSLQLAMPVVTIAAAVLLLGEAITAEIATITAAIVFGTWWAHRRAD